MDAAARDTARRAAIAECVGDIRAIEKAEGTTRPALDRIQARLLELAARTELFPVSDFPPPAPDAERKNTLYRLSEDADHRFALYAQLCTGGVRTPAHDHTTWAVIVGLHGSETNRLYQRDEKAGVRQTDEVVVEPGAGVAFMPDDLHSIEIEPTSTVLNFHMYGLALEQLHGRRYYKESTGEWLHFPASSGICDLPAAA